MTAPAADKSAAAPADQRIERMAENYAHCEQLLRSHDRDRWLACMFADRKSVV